MMKRHLQGLLFVALSASACTAAAQFSANIGITSNYLWRGVTQSENDPAVFGGLDFAADNGLYVGTWASMVEFGGDGGAEVDLYGGWSGGDEFTYDVGFTYYLYPDYDASDFGEIYGSLGWQWFTAGAAVTVTSELPDPSPFAEGDVYAYLNGSFDVMEQLNLSVTVGHYWFSDDGEDFDGDLLGDKLDYAHGQADLTWSTGIFGDVTASVSIAGKASGDNDVRGVLTWSYTWEQ